jgi:hypothetical protein
VPVEGQRCLQTAQPSCQTLAERIAIAWAVVAAADPKRERHFELPAGQWARRELLGCSDWWLGVDFGWRRRCRPGHRPWPVVAAEVPAVRARAVLLASADCPEGPLAANRCLAAGERDSREIAIPDFLAQPLLRLYARPLAPLHEGPCSGRSGSFALDLTTSNRQRCQADQPASGPEGWSDCPEVTCPAHRLSAPEAV